MRDIYEILHESMAAHRSIVDKVSWIGNALPKYNLPEIYNHPFPAIDLAMKASKFSNMEFASTGLDRVIKSLPTTILNSGIQSTIDRIILNQNRFVSNANILASFAQPQNNILVMRDLNNLFAGATTKLAYIASISEDEEDINLVENITQVASGIVKSVADKEYVTIDDLAVFQENLIARIESVLDSNKDKKGLIGLWLSVISILITIMIGLLPYFIKPGQNNGTTIEQFNQFKTDTVKSVDTLIKGKTISRKILLNCKIRLKPKTRTQILGIAKKSAIVPILDTLGEWAFISTVDSSDDFPISGWVKKKYLSKK